MKDLLQNVLDDILADVPKEKIDERISIFKRNMHNLSYEVMACLLYTSDAADE